MIVKLPFSLTERFKQITQQGIGVPNLDTSFVSSGSWYMIAQMGLMKLLSVFMQGSAAGEYQKMMQMQMGPAAGMMQQQGAPQGWMAKKAFADEKNNLSVCRYSNSLLSSEAELVDMLQKRRR